MISWLTNHQNDFTPTQVRGITDSSNHTVNALVDHSTGYCFQQKPGFSMHSLASRNFLVGMIAGCVARYYFLAMAVKEGCFCVYETGRVTNQVYTSYQRHCRDTQFSWDRFTQDKEACFSPAWRHAREAVKHTGAYLTCSFFGLDALRFGNNLLHGISLGLYGIKNPIQFRRNWSRFESWWRANTPRKLDAEVSQMDYLARFKGHFWDGDVNLSQLLFNDAIPIGILNQDMIQVKQD